MSCCACWPPTGHHEHHLHKGGGRLEVTAASGRQGYRQEHEGQVLPPLGYHRGLHPSNPVCTAVSFSHRIHTHLPAIRNEIGDFLEQRKTKTETISHTPSCSTKCIKLREKHSCCTLSPTGLETSTCLWEEKWLKQTALYFSIHIEFTHIYLQYEMKLEDLFRKK